MQRGDFIELFEIMKGLPVTIRLLDPPLHEFLPHGDEEIAAVARNMGVDRRARQPRARAARVQSDAGLPRLPHRHCLSGSRRDASARDLRGRGRGRKRTGKPVVPEVMVPLIATRPSSTSSRRASTPCTGGDERERREAELQVGTMIELPPRR